MNDLETLVLNIIGENVTTPDVFTSGSSGMLQVTGSLNDAIQEIALITGGQKREYHLPLVASTIFYTPTWTTDQFAWVTDAWLVSQKRRLEQVDLYKLTHNNSRWMFSSKSPEAYFPIGTNIIGVYPTPANADVIRFTCVVVPDRYSVDTDRIKLRKDLRWAAVYYAVSEYWASRGDATTALEYFTEYAKRVGIHDKMPTYYDEKRSFSTTKETKVID